MLEEFMEALEKQRGIRLSRATLLRYLKAGRIEGAVMGKDATGVRRAWHIPAEAVQSFQLMPRGNPNLIEDKN